MPGINDYMNIPEISVDSLDAKLDDFIKAGEILNSAKINLEVVIASHGGDAVTTTPQIR